MSQVTIIINGHRYRLVCEPGEEERVAQLGEYISRHVRSLKQGIGAVGNDRLLVMAALTITDELWDARHELREMQNRLDQTSSPQLALELQSAVARIESLKIRLQELETERARFKYNIYKEA